jgi:hypothetical protein
VKPGNDELLPAHPLNVHPHEYKELQMMNKFRGFALLMLIMFAVPSVNAQGNEPNAVITLERTACHGTCPIYTVAVLEDGTVLYEGENFVSVIGKQTSEIAPETVAAMVAAFRDAGYFDWNDAYDMQTVSDLPTVITSVTHDGTTKRIERYTGDTSAPLALRFLEQWIDDVTNTALWTGIQPDISAISNGTDTPLVTLQQGANFGTGAVYTVAAYQDGSVVYSGIANVKELGVHVVETDPSTITSLAQTAQILGYFDWQDSYEQRVITDQATIITSIRSADQFKQITRYDGDPNAPVGLVRIEASLARLVADWVGEP